MTWWFTDIYLTFRPYFVAVFPATSLVGYVATAVRQANLKVRILIKDAAKYDMSGSQGSIQGITD